jgi:two-component system response regulator
VLLAEDDADDCLLLSDAFAEAGVAARLHTVRDGEALVKHLMGRLGADGRPREEVPVLLICDINMPRMNGIEAVREIRTHSAYLSLPIVMLSSSRREEDRLRSREAGADEHLVKPMSFGELREIVTRLGQRYLAVENAIGRG